MRQYFAVGLSVAAIAASIGAYLWNGQPRTQRQADPQSTSDLALNVPAKADSDGARSSEIEELESSLDSMLDGATTKPIEAAKPVLSLEDEESKKVPVLLTTFQDGVSRSTPTASVPAGLRVPTEGVPVPALETSSDGTLRCKSTLTFVNDIKIAAEADGMIRKFNVDEGQLVKADEIILQIDNLLPLAEQEIAERELESAKLKAEDDSQIKYARASYDVAKKVFERSDALFNKGVESDEDWEKKKLEMIKATFQIDVSKREQLINAADVGVKQAKLNASKIQVDRRSVRAPFDGVVAKTEKELYDTVKAGEEILRFVSMKRLRARGSVVVQESPNQLVGRKAKVTVMVAPNESAVVEGRVGFVSPEATTKNEYPIWVEIENQVLPDGQYRFRSKMDAIVDILPIR